MAALHACSEYARSGLQRHICNDFSSELATSDAGWAGQLTWKMAQRAAVEEVQTNEHAASESCPADIAGPGSYAEQKGTRLHPLKAAPKIINIIQAPANRNHGQRSCFIARATHKGSPQPREGDFISSPQASFQYVLAASFSLSLLPWRPVGPLRTAQLWMGRSRHARSRAKTSCRTTTDLPEFCLSFAHSQAAPLLLQGPADTSKIP